MAVKTTLPAHDAIVRALAETPASPWPDSDDRAAWEQAASTPHGAAIRAAALEAAEEYARAPSIPPTMTDFLIYTRTGDRGPYQARMGVMNARLDAFTLAACFTNEPRWMDAAADALWALCEVTTWVWPAHEPHPLPDPDYPYIDLAAAMRAQEVAETLQLLGPALDRIDRRLRQRALRELDRRIWQPFLARGDFWWLWLQPDRSHLNNWTAVCSGGVLLGALGALNHDPEKQARIVRKAAWSLGFFRDTFGAAGSLDEGAGYWAYGVSYYAMAAERLAARTSGAIDLLADPDWGEIARFPLRVNLYGDTFVNFSDCAETVSTLPGWLAWFGRRMAAPGLAAWAARLQEKERSRLGIRNRHLPFLLRNLFWMDGTEVSAPPERELAVYLPDVQWLIARSGPSEDALILAAKGGHNDESHNHNDIGSLIVHCRQEALIAELGSPTYTRQFFQEPTRYENIASRSLGHSVPVVNGREQAAGRDHAAEVTAQGDASLSLQLANCYPPEAGLVSLRRDLALHRAEDKGYITLSDRATFAADGGALALPLMTKDCAAEVIAPGEARITGARGRLDIAWDPAQAACRAEEFPTDDPKFTDAAGKTRLRRLWFEVKVTGKEARLDLTIKPAPA